MCHAVGIMALREDSTLRVGESDTTERSKSPNPNNRCTKGSSTGRAQ